MKVYTKVFCTSILVQEAQVPWRIVMICGSNFWPIQPLIIWKSTSWTLSKCLQNSRHLTPSWICLGAKTWYPAPCLRKGPLAAVQSRKTTVFLHLGAVVSPFSEKESFQAPRTFNCRNFKVLPRFTHQKEPLSSSTTGNCGPNISSSRAFLLPPATGGQKIGSPTVLDKRADWGHGGAAVKTSLERRGKTWGRHQKPLAILRDV